MVLEEGLPQVELLDVVAVPEELEPDPGLFEDEEEPLPVPVDEPVPEVEVPAAELLPEGEYVPHEMSRSVTESSMRISELVAMQEVEPSVHTKVSTSQKVCCCEPASPQPAVKDTRTRSVELDH